MLNAAIAIALVVFTISAVGGQILCMGKNLLADESKEVDSEKSITVLACTHQEGCPTNAQKVEGEQAMLLVQLFEDWMDEYENQYPDEETRLNRFSIFKANVELHGYDTYKEYRSALDTLFYDDLVPNVDWVEAGVVSPFVRKQHTCGCCWAMAVVASVEALHYMKTEESILLSVQELIDCVSENHGCNGGYARPTLEYIQKNGLSSESSYGYTDRSHGWCRKGNKAVVATISGFNTVNTTEEALEEAVAKQPVILHLQWPPSMHTYQGGIIDYEYHPQNLPVGTAVRWHYVLFVGYGIDSNGVKYWRFKNLWGDNWGEDGYGRIRRYIADTRGVLGMFRDPTVYPV
ncbi:unnamed protein product [Alopecurus aequalis]